MKPNTTIRRDAASCSVLEFFDVRYAGKKTNLWLEMDTVLGTEKENAPPVFRVHVGGKTVFKYEMNLK
jgi:hypothetical protein